MRRVAEIADAHARRLSVGYMALREMADAQIHRTSLHHPAGADGLQSPIGIGPPTRVAGRSDPAADDPSLRRVKSDDCAASMAVAEIIGGEFRANLTCSAGH